MAVIILAKYAGHRNSYNIFFATAGYAERHSQAS